MHSCNHELALPLGPVKRRRQRVKSGEDGARVALVASPGRSLALTHTRRGRRSPHTGAAGTVLWRRVAWSSGAGAARRQLENRACYYKLLVRSSSQGRPHRICLGEDEAAGMNRCARDFAYPTLLAR